MLEEVKLEVDMIEERFEEDFRLNSRVVKGLGFSCPSRSSLDTIVLLALFSDLSFGFRSALGLLVDFRRSMRASMFAGLRICVFWSGTSSEALVGVMLLLYSVYLLVSGSVG